MPDLSSVTGVRRTYARGDLYEADLAPDWVGQFTRWYDDVVASEQEMADAFADAGLIPEPIDVAPFFSDQFADVTTVKG